MQSTFWSLGETSFLSPSIDSVSSSSTPSLLLIKPAVRLRQKLKNLHLMSLSPLLSYSITASPFLEFFSLLVAQVKRKSVWVNDLGLPKFSQVWRFSPSSFERYAALKKIPIMNVLPASHLSYSCLVQMTCVRIMRISQSFLNSWA